MLLGHCDEKALKNIVKDLLAASVVGVVIANVFICDQFLPIKTFFRDMMQQ